MFGKRRKVIANVVVGKADTKPSAPSHTRGVKEGNAPGNLEREPGIRPVDGMAVGTAERSTGIDPGSRNPIDPRSPNLSPA